MAKLFKLEIITPEKRFYDGEVEMVIVNTIAGQEGFEGGHLPACMMMDVGEIRIFEPGGKVLHACATDGFIDYADDVAIIFVEAVEWPKDIDVKRLEAKKQSLEADLSHPKDFDKAHIEEYKRSLKKAKNRQKMVAKYTGK